ETTIIRRPVQTLSGRRFPGRGARGSGRHVFFATLYATPSEKASPQHPPPQPISSRPVHTTPPKPSWIDSSREPGSCRHVFVTGLKASRVPWPQTSIFLPVQTELRSMKPVGERGGSRLRQVSPRGLYAVATL